VSHNSINKSNLRINDFLEPVTDLRSLHRAKFDPDSPLFQRAAANLQIDRIDIVKRKLKDFKREVVLEQPENETNEELVNDLAKIKYNYHISAFRDSINDIIEERDKLKYEETVR